MSDYLGKAGIVRLTLTTAETDFSWEIEYREARLELVGGQFQIPIMIKFDNLLDSCYLAYRLFLFGTISDDSLFISINNGEKFDMHRDDLEKLYSKIYNHLLEVFSIASFFEEYASDYRISKIGYIGESE